VNPTFRHFTDTANAEPDASRFAGAHAAARKHKVKRDIVRPKGHNREHAWILWSKIQRGHITAPETIKALTAEYGELFKEFASLQNAAGRGSAEGALG
jgi:hypothetical protein